eukprot:4361861-Prymnesium_polylepis.1
MRRRSRRRSSLDAALINMQPGVENTRLVDTDWPTLKEQMAQGLVDAGRKSETESAAVAQEELGGVGGGERSSLNRLSLHQQIEQGFTSHRAKRTDSFESPLKRTSFYGRKESAAVAPMGSKPATGKPAARSAAEADAPSVSTSNADAPSGSENRATGATLPPGVQALGVKEWLRREHARETSGLWLCRGALTRRCGSRPSSRPSSCASSSRHSCRSTAP